MSTAPDDPPPGAPSSIHLGPSKARTNWLAWLLLLLGILALLYFLLRPHDRVTTPGTIAATNTATPVAAAGTLALPGGRTLGVTPGSANEQLGTFLAGNEAAPRTFQLDAPNFETAKSAVRPADEQAIGDLAQILSAYPAAKVRLVGYADARGPDPVNVALGKARADAVKGALTAHGIDAARIETGSGGEADPIETNATAGGRFENRRTEIVVTAR